jgi:predicted dehydrogenase
LAPGAKVAAVRSRGRRFEIGNDLRADPGIDIVAKYEISELPDMAAALAWEPDAAIVATPSALHAAHARPLIEAGIPVLIEKPVTTDQASFESLCRAVALKSTPVMVGYHLRFHPCIRTLKAWLDAERSGRVQSIEVAVHSFMPAWHDYEKPNAFYAGVKALGGGVVLTECHEIDLLGWLFGRARVLAAAGGQLGAYDLDVEDTIAALLTFDLAGRRVPAALTLSFVQNPPLRRFAVNGERGRIVMDLLGLSVHLDGDERDEFRLPAGFDRNSIFLEEMREFIDCVRTRREPSTSLTEIRDGHMATLAILEKLARTPQRPAS